ncbi:putative Zn-dependent peptidase [Rubellimicrobium thermophilum DSM 16684]|uniref:Putative Zn-dependent peptidase n=1 Tax=Rubellimicrobium thermophilum DSM 16684 TaxID=1123069 RepID=S9RWY1_9RHOB|nr:pitrilysin family protein [Rubellimicrobium thermophilum]EPX82525.1 putative Zn-dependent peptidase [Rubellimicrobium thermophilum DSM 16684]
MPFRKPILAALICWPLALPAQEVTTATLDNGMQIVVIEDHRAPVAVHMVWYRTGSADEPVGRSGVAHFLEHLLFKATDDMEAGEFSRVVAENGGTDNAFTSYDYTAYYQRVAADRLELMMQMEADRMNDLRLTPEDIATERQVILEERSQRVDSDPSAIAREQMRAALWLNHRYGTPVIGWRHEMEALDMEDVLQTYDLWYSPNNAILVVAGDVDPAAVIAMAERHYGPLPAEPDLPPRIRAQEPPQLAARRVIYEDPRVAQPYLLRSYVAPARRTGDQKQAAALLTLARILGGSSFTSVLAEALTFDSEIALFTGADYDGVALDQGTFSLSVVPRPGVSLAEAEAAMDAALARFLEEGVDSGQLERIRVELAAAEIYAQDRIEELANRYGAALATGLTVADVKAWPDLLQSVTAEDVMAAAHALLDPRQSVTLWVSSGEETTP